MIKELLYKMFGVEPMPCPVCEVLRSQLIEANRERRELLQRALAPPIIEEKKEEIEEHIPITPQFIPWRVRQQMLEAEDRKRAQLTRDKDREITELEKELGVVPGKVVRGVSDASQ
jgi:hypothetical protein